MTGRVVETRAHCLQEIDRWVRETPGAAALLAPGSESLSFSQLSDRIASVAQLLRAAGPGPGDIVAVAAPDGLDLLPLLLGAFEVAAVAQLDWHYTEAELRARLSLIPACLLLTVSTGESRVAAAANAAGVPRIEVAFTPEGEIAPVTIPEISRHQHCVPPDCALILQTSATTGGPKVVPLTHDQVHAMCRGAQQGLAVLQSDRYLSVMPLHHILGFSCAVGQLMAGGSVACTGFDAQRFPAWLDELQPTWYSGGPALHQTILEIAKKDPAPFLRSPLRFLRCGSGAGSPALLTELEQVLHVNVINGYGLTEAGSVTNTLPHLPRKPGSVGRTIGPEIGIMDEQGKLLPPDSEGEVVLRGQAVMDGYLNDPETNREVLRNGWFHTGDLGRLDADGDLFITGRIKEVINRGGETIAPLEIDHAAAEHPAVARAASFKLPHPRLGEDVGIAIVLRPGASATAREIRSFLATRLSRSKIPSRIWFTQSIPLSASGKPLRDALSAQLQAQTAAAEPQEASTGPEPELSRATRQKIAAIWTEILGVDAPHPGDNLFGLGGDSLSAARMFALLEQEFHFAERLSEYAKFFDSPTLSQLERLVAQCTSADRTREDGCKELRYENAAAVEMQSKGEGPPIFFFPGEDLEPWHLRHVARHLSGEQPFFALRHHLADPSEFDAFAGRFAALISNIRPDGPIVLAGHCYGGILAYEVAQRLGGRSASQIAVILVDVNTPGYPKTRWRDYLRHLPRAVGELIRGRVRQLAADALAHFRYVRTIHGETAAARQDLATHSQKSALSPGGVVLRTYAPKPFQGRLVSAIARDHQVSARVLDDPRLGWRDFARGPFEECSVNGLHDTIFSSDNAPELARVIRSVVQATTG